MIIWFLLGSSQLRLVVANIRFVGDGSSLRCALLLIMSDCSGFKCISVNKFWFDCIVSPIFILGSTPEKPRVVSAFSNVLHNDIYHSYCSVAYQASSRHIHTFMFVQPAIPRPVCGNATWSLWVYFVRPSASDIDVQQGTLFVFVWDLTWTRDLPETPTKKNVVRH